MGLKLGLAKFYRSSARGTFQIGVLNGWGG